jgi:hypothetical protein
MRSFYSLCFLSFVTLYIAGCGGGDGPQLGYVTGKVTLNGQPLKGATVTISPATGSPSTGIVDQEGNYEMEYKFDRPGVTVGTHPIIVTVPIEFPPDTENLEKEQMEALVEELALETGVPKKWRDGSTTITVESGSNAFNIEMTRESAGG